MKIREVRVRTEDLRLTRPYTIAFRTVEAVSNVVVTLHAEDGRVGAGTGSPEPFVTGEDLPRCDVLTFGHEDLDDGLVHLGREFDAV